MILDEIRTDCPMTLPEVPSFEKEPIQISEELMDITML